MRSYLQIALQVACPAQPIPSDPEPHARASTKHVPSQLRPSPIKAADKRKAQSNGLAPCGSSDCAGCYDVGDARKIHPPKIGEGYREWLERWKPNGKVQ